MFLFALYAVLKDKRPRRVMRVVPFVLLLIVMCVTAKARAARAQVVSAALSMGREMESALPENDGKTIVRLNGERVIVGRIREDASLHDVLDRLEKGCLEGGGTFARAWEDAAKARAIAGSLRHGILREENADEGLVVCIVEGGASARTMTEALDRFEQTHDLGSIGRVHYAYARAHGTRTEVVTVETGDTFSFDRLAPPDGAPGGSESTLPLPAQTHRVLTAEIEQSPFSLRVYQSELSPRAALAFYETTLRERGFVPVDGASPPEAERGRNQDDEHRMYVRGAAQVIVMAREEGDDHHTVIALGEAVN